MPQLCADDFLADRHIGFFLLPASAVEEGHPMLGDALGARIDARVRAGQLTERLGARVQVAIPVRASSAARAAAALKKSGPTRAEALQVVSAQEAARVYRALLAKPAEDMRSVRPQAPYRVWLASLGARVALPRHAALARAPAPHAMSPGELVAEFFSADDASACLASFMMSPAMRGFQGELIGAFSAAFLEQCLSSALRDPIEADPHRPSRR